MTEEELRKESTYTVQWECTPMLDRPTFINGYITGAMPREERITKLEEENAELKERIKWYSEQICNKECAEVWGELTKAKEIIEKLSKSLFLAKGIIRDLIDDTVDFKESKEAVQFLKEVTE